MLAPIQRGELVTRLRRFFGVTGGFDASVESVVNAVVSVQDLSEPPYRQSVVGFSGNVNQAAVGAQFSVGELRNPAGASLIVVDRVICRASGLAAASDFFLRLGGPQAFTVFSTNSANTDGAPLDTANAPQVTPPQQFAGTTAAGPFVGTVIASKQASAAGTVDFLGPFVLLPTHALSVTMGVVNLALSVTFQGRIFTDPSLATRGQ